MPDKPHKQDNPDPAPVAGDGGKVEDLADDHDLSIHQAVDLVEKHGNNRETLEREAKNLKA